MSNRTCSGNTNKRAKCNKMLWYSHLDKVKDERLMCLLSICECLKKQSHKVQINEE